MKQGRGAHSLGRLNVGAFALHSFCDQRSRDIVLKGLASDVGGRIDVATAENGLYASHVFYLKLSHTKVITEITAIRVSAHFWASLGG
jgi:hypothetical protein